VSTGEPQVAQIKQMMKAMWSAGDFGKVAAWMEPEAAAFVGRLGLKPGMRVLDVGCGTGNQSVPAARLGALVTGVDIAPNLLAQAIARAREQKLDIEFREGDAEDLPFADGAFDVVFSMFGAMFAPRPELVVSEFLRVCRPDGMIAMANWTREGFFGEQQLIMRGYTPAPPPWMAAPVLWGDEAVVRERFGPSAQIETPKRMLTFDFPFGPSEVVEYFRQHIGPMHVTYAQLDSAKQQALTKELVEHWSRRNQGDAHHTVVPGEYLEVHVRLCSMNGPV
jgi:ubiquinone/menaquinone biosynthesis C-methylase UbiE